MPEFTYDQIINDIQHKIYHPVYLLHGEEAYFIDAIVNFMEENVLSPDERAFNQTVTYGLETSIEALIHTARSYPLSANYQLVIVKEAQLMKDLGQLELYLKAPLQSTILVLAHKHKEMDKRLRLYKEIKKVGVCFSAKKLWDNKIPDWIQSQLRQMSYKIQPQETALLAEYLGNDLSKISKELEKLTINIKKGGTITPELIEENIGISKDYNVFALTRALGERNIEQANKIISYFSNDQKNHSIHGIIPVLHQFFFKSLVSYQVKDNNRNSRAARLGVPPGLLGQYDMCANNYKPMQLAAIIRYLNEADLKAKGMYATASLSEKEILKELIFNILHV